MYRVQKMWHVGRIFTSRKDTFISLRILSLKITDNVKRNNILFFVMGNEEVVNKKGDSIMRFLNTNVLIRFSNGSPLSYA